MGALFTVLFSIILLVPISLISGWAASVMWMWFMVPNGSPSIDPIDMAGIILMIALIRYKPAVQGPLVNTLLTFMIFLCITMITGWVLHAITLYAGS